MNDLTNPAASCIETALMFEPQVLSVILGPFEELRKKLLDIYVDITHHKDRRIPAQG